MICTQSAAISEVMKKLGITESEATKLLAIQEKTMSAKQNESKVLFDSQTDYLEGNKINVKPKVYDGSAALNEVTDYSETLADKKVILFNSKSKKIIEFNGKELPAAALSNFTNLAVPIADNTGIMYSNIEAYYMAEQYSPNSHHRLALSKLSGLEAKQYSFKDDNWKGKIKLNNLDRAEIMERAMFHKFSTDLLLAEFIDVFHDFAFIEEMDPSTKARKAPEDNIWGASTKYKTKSLSLLGVNNTGKVMEKVRKRILSGEKYDTQHYPSHTKTHYVGGVSSLADNEVFVFGSNNSGINGNILYKKGNKPDGELASFYTGGAALSAQINGWVDQGEKMENTFSKNGKSYGLLTASPPFKNEIISKDVIVDNIMKLYETASSTKDKKFLVAYNKYSTNLNGYNPDTMVQMFYKADKLYMEKHNTKERPVNIIFHDSFYSDLLDSHAKNLSVDASLELITIEDKIFADNSENGIIIGNGINGAKIKYFNNEGIYSARIPVTKEFYKNLSPEKYHSIKYKLNSLS